METVLGTIENFIVEPQSGDPFHKKFNKDLPLKSRKNAERDEVQQLFVPHSVAANKCDATMLNRIPNAWTKKFYL
jgi:hypothetical protein